MTAAALVRAACAGDGFGRLAMLQLRPRDTLSGGDFGWLKARHHFRVTPQGNPAHEPLGALVVWNDDEIAPGGGFDLHGHKDMEIISYVREGAVTHRDTIGSLGRTEAEIGRAHV